MWMSPSHPETPDAPTFDMSITVGENTAREMGLTRLDVDEWAAYSHGQAHRVDRLGCVRGGDRRRSSTPTARATRACSASTSTPVAARRSRRSPTSSRCTPSSTTRPSPPATPPGSTTPPPRWCSTADDYAEAHGLRPLARIVSWASSGLEPARTGHGPDAGDPEGARARRPDHRRHRPVRDQRGVLLGAGGGDPHARHRPDDRERERQRLQPRSPDRGDRCPHGRHDGQRAAAPGQDARGRVRCARAAAWVRRWCSRSPREPSTSI